MEKWLLSGTGNKEVGYLRNQQIKKWVLCGTKNQDVDSLQIKKSRKRFFQRRTFNTVYTAPVGLTCRPKWITQIRG
jgi:hypothetical protein